MPTTSPPDAVTRRAWFDSMVRIRAFEDRVQELFMSGAIGGTTHLCQGQEAVCVGAVGALEERDYLTITYRGHGQALAGALLAPRTRRPGSAPVGAPSR